MRGFEQIYEVNYNQIFVSMIKSISFKVLFAIIIHYDLNYKQMNVITAFLNALLKELIYIKFSIEYKISNIIYQLLRVLYNLK